MFPTIGRSAKSGLVAFALVVVMGGAACGGRSLQHDATSNDPPAEAGRGQPRDTACGGTVQATGSTPNGSFDANYISAILIRGDCTGFFVEVAETSRSDSDAFFLHPPVGSSGSYLGTSTGTASYQTTSGSMRGASEVMATVTVTGFPDPPPTNASDLADGGSDVVTGSFSIETPGFSLAGTFSTPICAFNVCI